MADFIIGDLTETLDDTIYTKPKLLITGGNGLVGSAFKEIAHQYEDKYDFIFLSSSDCDLTDYECTLSLFQSIRPKIVIHLAACVGGLYKNMNYKLDMFEKNVLINMNVLRSCHLTDIDRVICMLSTCIFPDDTEYPINEHMLHDGPPHYSNDAYAYAKRMMEVHCRAYNDQYGRNYSCIIPTNIYGKHDNYSLEDGHVIPALIHKCYLAKKNNVDFEVRGTGKPLRQFILSTDLAHGIMQNIDRDHCANMIISTSEEITIGEVACLIAAEFDYEHHVKSNSNYSDGQYKKTADNSKFLSMNPGFNFTDFKVGLRDAVKFFVENYDTCRK
jgi:GDP-L-fucose synthase